MKHYMLVGQKVEECEYSLLEWAKVFEETNHRVAWDRATRHAKVSTVFLGIDHRWVLEGPPLLFETMVVGGPLDQYRDRYSTWDEAAAGHNTILRQAKKARYYKRKME